MGLCSLFTPADVYPVIQLFKVKLANGAKVLWDGKSRAYVTVPHSQRNKVKGLCGTFNGITKDDFMTKSNVIEPNHNVFGRFHVSLSLFR